MIFLARHSDKRCWTWKTRGEKKGYDHVKKDSDDDVAFYDRGEKLNGAFGLYFGFKNKILGLKKNIKMGWVVIS